MRKTKSMFIAVALAALFLFPLSAQAQPPFPPGPPLEGLQDAIDKEVQDRIDGDQALQGAIDQEAADRAADDQALQDQIDDLAPSRGYQGKSGAVFIPSNASNSTAWVASEDGYGYLREDQHVPEDGLRTCDDECVWPVSPYVGTVDLLISVNLPEGVEVTDFDCFWYDNVGGGGDDPGASLTFKLMKKPWYDLAATTMATVSQVTNAFTPLPNVRPTSAPSISEPVINNLQNSYYIAGHWEQDEMSSSLRFYGCLISFNP